MTRVGRPVEGRHESILATVFAVAICPSLVTRSIVPMG